MTSILEAEINPWDDVPTKGASINPELRERHLAELEAVGEGDGPLNEENVQQLGELSMGSYHLDNLRDKSERAKANLELLTNFVALLPKYEQGFKLTGPYEQYMARQIQANTLWSCRPGPHAATGSRQPYYIIGRHRLGEEREVLLLLDASYDEEFGPNPPVYAVDVSADDMRYRDEISQHLPFKEFSDIEISKMFNQESESLDVRSTTSGSIELVNSNREKDSSIERVSEKGVRRYSRSWNGDRWDSKIDFSNGISDELMQSFHLETIMARLASAFRVEAELKLLLEGKEPEKAPSFEDLVSQNNELKQTLRNLLQAIGFTQEEAQQKIDSQYPTFNVHDK